MIKIGDFSRISMVSVKALRYYDEIGLLKPACVDEQTGYRYYTADQLPRLHRLLALKDLGFSLEQIGPLLNVNVPVEQLRGMLLLRRSELHRHLSREQERLKRVEARLRSLQQEGCPSHYEVVLKRLPCVEVASLRRTIAGYPSVALLIEELIAFLDRQGVKSEGPCGALWHDNGYKEHDVDTEAWIPLAGVLKQRGDIRAYPLPEIEVAACVVHHGPYAALHQAYAFLLTWIAENGYAVCDSDRSVYLRGGMKRDDTSYVTELQFPISTLTRFDLISTSSDHVSDHVRLSDHLR
jgi:DNA-binding transcriptional MerR regulator